MIIERGVIRNPQYSIRKLNFGVASVAVGTLLSLGVANVNAQEMQTLENISNEEIIVKSSEIEDSPNMEVLEDIAYSQNKKEDLLESINSEDSIDESKEITIEEAPEGSLLSKENIYILEEDATQSNPVIDVEEIETSHNKFEFDEEIIEAPVTDSEIIVEEMEESVSDPSPGYPGYPDNPGEPGPSVPAPDPSGTIDDSIPEPIEPDDEYEEDSADEDNDYIFNPNESKYNYVGEVDFSDIYVIKNIDSEISIYENDLETQKIRYEENISNIKSYLAQINSHLLEKDSQMYDAQKNIAKLVEFLNDNDENLMYKYHDLDYINWGHIDYDQELVDAIEREIQELLELQQNESESLTEQLNLFYSLKSDYENYQWEQSTYSDSLYFEEEAYREQSMPLIHQIERLSSLRAELEEKFTTINETLSQHEYRRLQNIRENYTNNIFYLENDRSYYYNDLDYYQNIADEIHRELNSLYSITRDLEDERTDLENDLQERNSHLDSIQSYLQKLNTNNSNYYTLNNYYYDLRNDLYSLENNINNISNNLYYYYNEIFNKESNLSNYYDNINFNYQHINELNQEIDFIYQYVQFYDYMFSNYEKESFINELISISLDKNSYNVGETAELKVEFAVPNFEHLSDLSFYANFNNGRYSSDYLSLNTNSFSQTTYLNEKGNYESKIKIHLPHNYPSEIFDLSSLSISFFDNSMNYYEYYSIYQEDDSRLKDISIHLTNPNPETIDIDAPIVNHVSADHTDYSAGDTIYLRVDVEDKNLIKEIRARLEETTESRDQRSEDSEQSIDSYLEFTFHDVEINDNTQAFYLKYEIPKNWPNLDLILSTLQVTDQFGNSTYLDINYSELEPLIFHVTNSTNSQGDLEGPEILNFFTDKTTYETGEKIKLHVEVTDSSEINFESLSAYFRNTVGKGEVFLLRDYTIEDISKNQDGNYEAVYVFDIPQNIMSGSFHLENLGIQDTYYNYQRINENSLANSTINIIQREPEKLDFEGPQMIRLDFDKRVYKAGETANMTIELTDKSPIHRAALTFRNNWDYREIVVDSWDFYINEYGNYQASVPIEISKSALPGSYKLDYSLLTDIYANIQYPAGSPFLDLIFFEVENEEYVVPPVSVPDPDSNPDAEIINVNFDNNILNFKDNTKVIIEVESSSNLQEVVLNFQGQRSNRYNESNYFISKSQDITLTPEGNYEVIFNLEVPEDSLTNIFTLTSLTLIDTKDYETNIYRDELFSSAVLYYINPDAEAKEKDKVLIKDISFDKEYYSENDIAKAVIEIQSTKNINSVVVNLDMIKDWFSKGHSFFYPVELTDLVEVSPNLYHVNYEFPIHYPQEIDNLFLQVLNLKDDQENYFYEFEGDRLYTIKLQHTKEESKVETLPFETIRLPFSDLPEGEEKILQLGSDGVRTVYYDVNYHAGEELSRKLNREEITQNPINQIILVGSQKNEVEVLETEKPGIEETTRDTSTQTEVIPFETEYIDNPHLPVGYEKPLNKGQNGSRVTESSTAITTVDGVEVSRKETSNVTVINPINEIIERGTKVAEDDEHKGSDSDKGDLPNPPAPKDEDKEKEDPIIEDGKTDEEKNNSSDLPKHEDNNDSIIDEGIKESEDVGTEPETPVSKDDRPVVDEVEGDPVNLNSHEPEKYDSNILDDSSILLDSSNLQQSSVVTLPQTGEVNNPYLAAVGTSILAGMGLLAAGKRKEEN